MLKKRKERSFLVVVFFLSFNLQCLVYCLSASTRCFCLSVENLLPRNNSEKFWHLLITHTNTRVLLETDALNTNVDFVVYICV